MVKTAMVKAESTLEVVLFKIIEITLRELQ
jgi:hypothetical protein